ncbi:MAG: hypothetical protein QOH28_2858 [Actinomycetota bacterium]|jgi:arsenate reductase|nr:hypothetical protein [Actinomycetota bacterium]
MRPDLTRRAVAEFVGTAFLVAVVIGSGIAAQRLSPGDVGLQLFENAAATAAGLIAIILAIGPVSGAHLNPLVSLADAAFGGLDRRELVAYVPAQIAGGMGGAIVANLMFSLPAVEWSTKTRSGGGLWLAEAVATGGLLLVVFGVARSGRSSVAPFAVGAYIGAAYWFTASTSFANPAVTIARAFSNTFAGIEPSSVPAFVAFQVVGAAVAVVLVRYLYPDVRAVAGDIIVPPIEAVASTVPEILYVCIHNAGRSVAAAVLTDHYARGRVHVRSAGSQPGSGVNVAVAQVLRERGLDPDKEFPKPLTAEAARAADVIITMGCGDACPFYPGTRYLDWELTDPAGKTVEEVRPIIEHIDERVRQLLAELLGEPVA